MESRFWQQELECMPLPQIAAFQDERLKQSQLVERAYGSALYKTSWQEAGLAPGSIRGRADLKHVPYLTGSALRDAFASHAVNDILTSQNVRFWFCTSGTTGAPKWIPYADADISLSEQIMMRDICLCGADRAKLRWLALTTPAPFVADGAAHIAIFAELLNGLENEHILVVATETSSCMELARARKINVLYAFPSVAMRIAEGISEGAREETKRQFRERKSLANLAAMLVARFKRIRARDIIQCQHGLFSGEALAPYRQAIVENYGLEPYEMYTSTEFLCFNLECKYHCGIHLWLDTCIAEIIPREELDKEERTPDYIPQAQFMEEVAEGTVGEYVLTTFGEALPMVRYRTSDLLEVVGTKTCQCGRTHPRVRIPQRLDDIVNMGLIRFSILEVEACLGRVSRSGTITNWQLKMEREGYRPKPLLFIQGNASNAEQDLLDEVRSRMMEIAILKTGCERGLVAHPEIRMVPRIDEVRTATGKLRRVIYGDTW